MFRFWSMYLFFSSLISFWVYTGFTALILDRYRCGHAPLPCSLCAAASPSSS